MSKRKQCKSEALAAIHKTMDALHQIEAIDEKTMRDFDVVCLADLPEMEKIRALLNFNHMGRSDFVWKLSSL